MKNETGMRPKEGREGGGRAGRRESVSVWDVEAGGTSLPFIQRTGKQKRVGVDTKWIGSCEVNGQRQISRRRKQICLFTYIHSSQKNVTQVVIRM